MLDSHGQGPHGHVCSKCIHKPTPKQTGLYASATQVLVKEWIQNMDSHSRPDKSECRPFS